MLQISQAAVDDTARPAGRACAKVALLHQQCAFAGLGALLRNGNAIDAAADNDHVEALTIQRRPRVRGPATHLYLDAGLGRLESHSRERQDGYAFSRCHSEEAFRPTKNLVGKKVRGKSETTRKPAE